MRWCIIKTLLEVSLLHGVRSAQSNQGESTSYLNVQAIGYNWDIVIVDSKPCHNKSNKYCKRVFFCSGLSKHIELCDLLD